MSSRLSAGANSSWPDEENIRRLLELVDQPSSVTAAEPSADDYDVAALAALLADTWSRLRPQKGDGDDSATTEVPAESAAKLPRQIGRFEIRGILGCGGFGLVLLAYDPHLHREVALKLPRPEILLSHRLRQRFLREAQAAALLDHSNIVPVYEAAELGPLWYLTRGYVAGPTLGEWLDEQGGAVAPRIAAEMVRQLATAVEHAHSRGVLHRDLKPSNVLLEPIAGQPGRWVVKLADFGLAKRIEDTDQISRQGELLGTPQYMAPEQATCRAADVAVHTDIYGLGVILFELLTGKPPYVGTNDQQTLHLIQEGNPPLHALRSSEVPRNLEAVCLKCLAASPQLRYQSAAQLLADLNRFLAGEPVQARSVGRATRVWLWCRRKPVAATSGLAAVLLIAGSVGMAVWHWRQSVTYARQVEQSLIEAEHGLVNLAWAQDEALRTPHSNDPIKVDIRRRLLTHYQALLASHSVPQSSLSFRAAAASLQARVAELSDNREEAFAGYERSIGMWRELLQGAPDHPQYRRALAENLHSLRVLKQTLDDIDVSQPNHAADEKLFAELLGEDHGAGLFCSTYVQLLLERGEALVQLGAHRDALALFGEASQLSQRLATAHPENPDFVFNSCQAVLLWSIALRQLGGDPTAQEAVFISQQQARRLAEQNPLNESYRLLQAQLGRMIAQASVKNGATERAVAYYEGVYQVLHGLPEDRWREHSALNLLADTARELSKLYRAQPNPNAQLAMLKEATSLSEHARNGGFISRENLGDLGYCYQELGDLCRERANPREAAQAYRRACEMFRLTVGRSVKERKGRLAWAGCHAAQAELAREQSHYDAARAQYRDAISVLQTYRETHSADQQLQHQLDAYQAKLAELTETTPVPR